MRVTRKKYVQVMLTAEDEKRIVDAMLVANTVLFDKVTATQGAESAEYRLAKSTLDWFIEFLSSTK